MDNIRTKGQRILVNLFKSFHENDREYFKMYEKYGINTEKSIFNQTIKEVKSEFETVSWENPQFRKKYCEIFRKVKANLTYTPAAPEMIELLRQKKILPTKIASMKHSEMCPDFQERRRLEQIAMFKKDHHNPESIPQQQSSGMLTCGRCKGDKVSYFTKQTRSADEPETVFATCQSCGKKWRQ